jgi:hypothetical protein
MRLACYVQQLQCLSSAQISPGPLLHTKKPMLTAALSVAAN